MSLPRVLVPLADGVEEMEAVILIDVLRRACWTVVTAGLREGEVRASRGVRLTPDLTLEEALRETYDLILLPGGGPGTEALCQEERILAACRAQAGAGRALAALCAAPRVLDRAGLLAGRRYTCYPGVETRITSGQYVADAVVQDGFLHTSQGPGTAFAFALHLVGSLDSPEKAAELRRELVLGR